MMGCLPVGKEPLCSQELLPAHRSCKSVKLTFLELPGHLEGSRDAEGQSRKQTWSIYSKLYGQMRRCGNIEVYVSMEFLENLFKSSYCLYKVFNSQISTIDILLAYISFIHL